MEILMYMLFIPWSQIIPSDAYKAGRSDYDGVFYCRFWRFGQWVEVYIDDSVPVRQSGDSYVAWGARSCDPDEMWVTFMEKAFAK